MTSSEAEKIGALTATVASLERRLEAQEVMLREVRDTLISARGSWKTMVAIGGLISVITGLLVKFWPGH